MRLKWVVLLVVAAAAFFGGGWLLRRRLREVPAAPRPAVAGVATGRLFTNVFETVKSFAVDSLDEKALYRMATLGVLTEVGDPYAALVTGSDSGSVASLGEPSVQGIYLDQPEGYVEVVAVVPGSAGELAGVKPGDVILRVNDTRIELQRAEQVGRMIGGAETGTVRLRLGRDGGTGPLWVTVVRGPTPERTASGVTAAGGGVSLVRLTRIDEAAAGLVRRVLDSLKSGAGKGLVLDLRSTVDGSLANAIAVAEQFLDQGQTVVGHRAKRAVQGEVTRGGQSAPGTELPVVLLVDRGTAGAAEVIAGALQDHDRAAVIGETTFGRGASQSLYPLGNGSSLRLTTNLWMTPSGRVIQRRPPAPLADGTADTATTRPKFKTDAGRQVLGGGGIVPDREIAVGKEPSKAEDLALAAARVLLGRAKDRRTLLAELDPK